MSCPAPRQIEVRLSGTHELIYLANDFPNQVLDQDLRESIAEETKSVRDLILAQAFSGLPILDPLGETADFRGDILAIGGSAQTFSKPSSSLLP